MKKLLVINTLFFVFPIVCLCQEMKKINNTLYSFELPSTWMEPFGKSSEPTIRKAGFYKIYSILWTTPTPENPSNERDWMLIHIESYERKDITMDEIYNLTLKMHSFSEKKLGKYTIEENQAISTSQRKFIVKQNGYDLKGTTQQVQSYYLYKIGNIVHSIKILQLKHIYEKKETKSLIQRIQDSFKLKDQL